MSAPNPPARLFTVFGTVLFVDGNGELRHGQIESSPANAYLVADRSAGTGLSGRLLAKGGGVENAVRCSAERCEASTTSGDGGSAASTQLEVVPLERGLFGLRSAGCYLSALPEGRVRLSAARCSTWECFLASEDWCGADDPSIGRVGVDTRDPSIAALNIKKHVIDPRLRARAEAKSARKKVLIFGYPQWSHGRVYYEICKRLHARGYLVDILNWRANHAEYIEDLSSYYDLFLTSPGGDGVSTLADGYKVPLERMVVLAHSELDIQTLIEAKDFNTFDRFAGYGVVSYSVYSGSLVRGVRREPQVASLGVDCDEFSMPLATTLDTVGYASSMSLKVFGVELKRGNLAEAAAKDAGLNFKVAGSTAGQTSFHDMPGFYQSVDAVLITSISESAGLPALEAAAAGRLVIGTPVGHFPLLAYHGGGMIAPIQADKFVEFASSTLQHHRARTSEYLDACSRAQTAARAFDWDEVIGEWADLIDAAH